MFDIAFSEMVVIAVVALIVIGPERLPKVARTLGHLWGRAQRYVNGVKADIARDMAVEEFRQLQQQVQREADDVRQAMQQTADAAERQARELDDAVAGAVRAASPAAQGQLELPPPAEQKKTFPVD